ncbi:MAG: type VI secretion system accessory protein TagJ [Verrucomicrobiota bacterium]
MSALSNINTLLLEGQLMDAVEASKQAVRSQPGAIEPRVVLYELAVLLGDWERCQNQVEAIMNLGGDPMHWLGHMANIHAAKQRQQCWQGQQRPPLLGACDAESQSMIDALWQAVVKFSTGDTAPIADHAAEFGGMAFGPGKVNGIAFEELSSIDSRLPGVIEVSEGGQYAWLWLGAVSRIEMQGGANNLCEVAWIPSRVFFDDGEVKALTIFGLYPGTEASANPRVVQGKATEWDDAEEPLAIGKGGQLLYVDERATPFQQLRLIEFDAAVATQSLATEHHA